MDLEHLLLNYLAQSQRRRTQTSPDHQGNKAGLPYLGVVHRLDQPVEGLLVFAKTKQAAASLSAQLSSDSMSKEYLALADGIPLAKKGTLTDYLLRDGRQNRSAVVKPGTQGAKKAILNYTCLQTDPTRNQSLLKIHLVTGRHHQIRVQLAHAGLPLVGDCKYHSAAGTGWQDTAPSPENTRTAPICDRAEKSSSGSSLALCAYRLTFRHPATGREMEYQISPKGSAFVYFSL